MVNLNKVLLVGNLTRDPELRYTPQGTAVVTLGIAVNRSFKNKNGQSQKDTCFVNVVVWSKMAEVCNQYLYKGRQIMVEGRLQSRSWQTSDGKNRTTLEIVATMVQFMPQGVKQEVKEQEVKEQEVKGQGVDLGLEPEEILNLGDNNVELGEAN